jgi:flagellar biosynthesis/type III secretory pathway chaperone
MSGIDHALNELRAALREFVGLLENEARVLKDGEPEQLAAIVAEKTRCSSTANTAWNRLIINAGIDTRRGDSLDALIGADHPQFPTWQETRGLINKAERLNRANGSLIEAQLQRTRQALDVLQAAADRGALYGANGRMVGGFLPGHSLDKA